MNVSEFGPAATNRTTSLIPPGLCRTWWRDITQKETFLPHRKSDYQLPWPVQVREGHHQGRARQAGKRAGGVGGGLAGADHHPTDTPEGHMKQDSYTYEILEVAAVNIF